MKINRLGRTGLRVSEICLGTMTFGMQADECASFAIMDRAIEAGVNFFDTADVYPVPVGDTTRGDTETIIGSWLRVAGRRDKIVLATKCRARMGSAAWSEGLNRKHILRAVEDSLRRLKTDYIDLYQAHSPDPETPIDETLAAFDSLVTSGKVRYIGCSNFAAYQLSKALWVSDKRGFARFDCVQPRYNLLFRHIEAELLPLCREEGVGVIAYNPLAGGFLTGKHVKQQDAAADTRFGVMKGRGSLYHDRYWQDAQFDAVEALKPAFADTGTSLAQAAIAWVLQQPGITSAIVGASRAEQLNETLKACTITLTPDQIAACDDAWYSLPRPRDPGVAFR